MAAESAIPPRPNAFDRLATALSERSNPVLVKEVRQSLRSTFFRVVFLLALLLTTIVAVGMLAFADPIRENTGSSMLGRGFFNATLASNAFCAVALVPFAAFASMNAETDQNALELLQLSNLRPISIVLGKLLATAIVAVLVASVELPFAFLAWTIGGIDPVDMLVTLAVVLAFSLCLSAGAIAISSMARTRWVRIVLMVVFGFFALMVAQYGVGVLVLGTFVGGAMTAGGIGGVAVGLCALALALDASATAAAFACDQLAHREESHSTPLRYVAAVSAITGGILAAVWKLVRPHDGEALGILGLTLLLTCLPLWLCCTEEERLPLGPRARPPAGGAFGWWRALFISGGGRGAALATVLLAFVGGAFVLACSVRSASTGGLGASLRDDGARAFVFCTYAWIYLLLPSGIASFVSASAAGRVASRALTLAFPLGAFLALTLAQLVLLGTAGSPADNIANPFFVAGRAQSLGNELPVALLALVAIAFATALVNAPRIIRGGRDLALARRERDGRMAAGATSRTASAELGAS